jgi:acetylornithine/N-succinyldiaminopimelate aminotransferase
LNVNADDAAAANRDRSCCLGAALIADVEGVLDESGKRIASLDQSDAGELIQNGVINRGMRAKLEAGFAALAGGVGRVRVSTLEGLDRFNLRDSSDFRAELDHMTTMTSTESPPSTPTILGTYKRAPMTFVRGEGVELIDADGKRYLDLASGISVNALGYGDAGIKQAMLAALDTGLVHVSNLYRTEPGEELSQLITRDSFAKSVFFCNSGAEANEGAFKFARRWGRATGSDAKTGMLALRGSFHGRSVSPRSLQPTGPRIVRRSGRLAGGISICERDLRRTRRSVGRRDDRRSDSRACAGRGRRPRTGEGIRSRAATITAERGIALIFDEIQCWTGRLGTFFAHQSFGVTPDIVNARQTACWWVADGELFSCRRKLRQPSSQATMERRLVEDRWWPPLHSRLFAELPILHYLQRFGKTGEWFGETLRGIGKRTGKVRAIRGMGYMWGMDVVEKASDVIERGWEAGVLIISAGDHTLRLLRRS